MDERRLEFKVGALALMALALAAGLWLALRGVSGGRQFVFHVDFGYAGGLPSGAAVKIAGVKVGRIASVALRPDAQDAEGRPAPVRLTATIDRTAAAALRTDAIATVGAQGALGENYLEVLPGTKRGRLAEGGAIRGLDPPRLDVLLARLSAVVEGA